MKGAITPVGYTIVEVMIVLSISGIMFLIAANFISGKQEATAFPQGVNQLAAKIQNTIEQVSDGQYSDVDLTCNFTYASPPQPPTDSAITNLGLNKTTDSSTDDLQGTISPCIFLGKVLQFNQKLPGLTADQQYETFVLAGGRLDSNQQPISADPNALTTTPLDDDAPTPITPLTTESTIPQRLDIIDINQQLTSNEPSSLTQPFSTDPVAATTSYGIGFIQSLGNNTSQSGGQNGFQPINLYYVSSLTGPMSQSSAQTAISGSTLHLVPPGQEIVMCVSDHTQYANIEIGSANSQLTVKVKMLGHGNRLCS